MSEQDANLDTILLWGIASDPPLAAVRNALASLQDRAPSGKTFRTVFIDQRAPLETALDLTVGQSIAGTLRFRNETVDLARIHSAYIRPFESRELTHAGPESDLRLGAAERRATDLDDALFTWAEITPALVLNRPGAMAANGSKPFQCAAVATFGFLVPETLITTEAQAALDFWSRHGDIVYKSLSSVRSIVSRMTPAHRARLHRIASCPTQFQQHIPGTDYRVHVVGDQVFACTVTANADDYRYASGDVAMEPAALPAEIASLCVRMAASMQLPLAGIDLRLTPRGEWYCFEVNPSPAFTVFEAQTGQPITRAVAHLLAAPEGAGAFRPPN